VARKYVFTRFKTLNDISDVAVEGGIVSNFPNFSRYPYTLEGKPETRSACTFNNSFLRHWRVIHQFVSGYE
jgi:hypothetical protein